MLEATVADCRHTSVAGSVSAVSGSVEAGARKAEGTDMFAEMSPTAVVVTAVAAFMAGFSGASVLARAAFVVEPLAAYGLPRTWWDWLGAAKVAGTVGLLVGFFVPLIGTLAAVGLVLYFAGAVVTVLRARSYGHVAFPLVYMAAAAVLVLA
ncbi:DoxX family protein [Streptomyces lateritius]|uniref:DoxX family protein n=1 Tax=Streptomyces lateritius TaxID=67313 RepID=A0ABW6Y6H7_9ACTN